jgi:hypothetical protein
MHPPPVPRNENFCLSLYEKHDHFCITPETGTFHLEAATQQHYTGRSAEVNNKNRDGRAAPVIWRRIFPDFAKDDIDVT